MSTRSQVRFTGPHGATAQVYRHSDGYPEGVLPDLRQLFDVMRETGTVRGASYAAANFVFFGKLRSLRLSVAGGWEDVSEIREDRTIQTTNPKRVIDPEEYKTLRQPHALLGYGVEEPGTIHGDEEYLYDVAFDSAGNVSIRVSERCGFPRFPESDESPFPEESGWGDVTWAYDGSLKGAINEYTDETVFDLPEEGTILRDPKAPSWSSKELRVVGVTDTPASDYELSGDDIDDDTVAEANPNEPEDAPVVEGEYINGSGKVYALPVTRLEER